jgi:hypothetical protein
MGLWCKSSNILTAYIRNIKPERSDIMEFEISVEQMDDLKRTPVLNDGSVQKPEN